MQDLRLVLIILGFIAIVALVAHGLWSNKKNQVKPLKDKPLSKVDANVKDKQGFDLDGIGEKRVVSQPVEQNISVTKAPVEPTPMTVEKIEPQFGAAEITQDTTVLTGAFTASDVETPSPTIDTAMNDVSYDVVETSAVEVKSAPVLEEQVAAESQTQNDLDNSGVDTADNTDTHAATVQDKPVDDTADEAVFVINIMAREGKSIAGAELLQELSAFGFKFGAMDIFHRHVDAAGKGPVIFSLANMVKPGVFDIDMMEQFESPGVSLFMMFPCAGQASHNYSLMLGAAERIAEAVDGLLMDGSRNPLTEEAIEQEQAFIRQLEQKVLAKKSN
ncbi:Cell division protein ZipA homolog [Moritella viscosa]|uniref:Cell division protein ZipA n=1 Tax=Moritella viscosa TaxID=80854 RepID=A0A090K5Z7_9GAMM|nr:cell division protein ZipA [Moritella viscosa]CED59218.1 cell division protein ZipA [Moritella viscosa]SGY86551.1 Cell division protein ZipA homolog [Moritella viscosa]SGY87461.1 Cell division protein ZipA homolog [Moritella viscosa]SHN99996.1 Cell division protein ZipA homolog [Moritella viscosa]SHO00004.1 Cell division protein ZipA homolog [Moritella viscosa]